MSTAWFPVAPRCPGYSARHEHPERLGEGLPRRDMTASQATPSPRPGSLKTPPPLSQAADYEDLVPGVGHWARAPPECPHGDRAALAPQPIAGLPAAQGRGRAAHQAAEPRAEGDGKGRGEVAPLPLSCRRSPGPGCPSSSSSSGQPLLPASSCRSASGSPPHSFPAGPVSPQTPSPPYARPATSGPSPPIRLPLLHHRSARFSSRSISSDRARWLWNEQIT